MIGVKEISSLNLNVLNNNSSPATNKTFDSQALIYPSSNILPLQLQKTETQTFYAGESFAYEITGKAIVKRL